MSLRSHRLNTRAFFVFAMTIGLTLGAAPMSAVARALQPAATAAAQPAPARKSKEKAPVDPDLLMGAGITAGRIRADGFTDATEKLTGRVFGNPMLTNLGPSEGFKFNGATDYLVVNASIERRPLPKRDLTISSWVSLHQLAPEACILDCSVAGESVNNGGLRLLGVGDKFGFELSAAEAAQASMPSPKPATRILSKTSIKPNKWYHVAATFDGRSMKLFVNGELEGESKDQTGEVAFAGTPSYLVAARNAAGSKTPVPALSGTVLEVKVFGRVFTPQQITEEYVPGVRLTSFSPEYEATQRFVARPYIQFTTKDETTIVLETSRPGRTIVEYGEQLPYDQRTPDATEDTLHKIRITGLKPGTNYFYRTRTISPDKTELLSEDLTFQTVTGPDVPFAFVVIGDTQKNKPVIEKLQAFAATLRPSLEIHVGDVVDKGPDKSEWTTEFLEGSYPLMSRVCMYPAIGNHENNHSNYYNYFALPSPQCWYTYTWGNAQFFSIDTNKPVDPSSEQYQWLDRELSKSTATWKFVYHHHPVYSSDEDDYGDTYKGKSALGDPKLRVLAELYEKHRVDFNFVGHIHSYERSWPIYQGKIDQAKGVRYVTSGGGGGGLESAGPCRTWFAQRVYRGHHICFLMIHDKTLEFQVFDLEGRLIDQTSVVKP